MLVTSAIRDVSERKRGEAELVKLEARYRSLVEEIPAVTFLAALDGGSNELYVSPQIVDLLGFTQEEWLGDPVLWHRQLPCRHLVRSGPCPHAAQGYDQLPDVGPDLGERADPANPRHAGSAGQPADQADEPAWMRLSTLVGAPAGAGVIRDTRAWHGATPNLSREIRAMPNVEYGAPWLDKALFAPSMPHEIWMGLSPHAQKIGPDQDPAGGVARGRRHDAPPGQRSRQGEGRPPAT